MLTLGFATINARLDRRGGDGKDYLLFAEDGDDRRT